VICPSVPLTAAAEEKLDVAEMKRLRWSLGITSRDIERNHTIQCKVGVAKVSKKVQESRLRWYGHVLRREDESLGS